MMTIDGTDQAVSDLLAAAEPGSVSPSAAELAALRSATSRLVQISGDAGRGELDRFVDTTARGIAIDVAALRGALEGRTVIVTGGTGCIGSAVVRELLALAPRRIVSVSRGLETRWPRFAGVEYLDLDIRDSCAVVELFGEIKPDVVYHLAAQHDPGRAEVEVHRTLSTNVAGTSNVLTACRFLPGVRLACASTGKALRPFTRDVYSSSKKITEWVLAAAAADPTVNVSAVRFTHVVDNSIILRRLEDWTAIDEPIRLHSLDTMFYVQSAREAAQLLISSILDAVPQRLAVAAIRDLGWPVALMELALGVLSTRSTRSPLYWCGFEAGYEKAPYPALYDPQVSGALSPLFNAFEAFDVEPSKGCVDLDVFYAANGSNLEVGALITKICELAASGGPVTELRSLVELCGWAMLGESLHLMSSEVLSRHLELLASKSTTSFSADDLGVRSMVESVAAGRADISAFR